MKCNYIKRLAFLVLPALLMPIASLAEEVEINGVTYNVSGETADVVKGNYHGSVVIPASVTYEDVTYSVTTITKEAFSGQIAMTSISIPASVTSIGESAFSGCTGLAAITVDAANPVYSSPSNCNAIVENATAQLCYGCKNTVIPPIVTKIAKSAFYGQTGLTAIALPEGLTSIGEQAFYGCNNLAAITIPSSLNTIGKNAFDGCTGLLSVTIDNPNFVATPRDPKNSFKTIFGSQVKNYAISSATTTIGKYAFYGCTDMTSFEIPAAVTRIDTSAFSMCRGLTSIALPAGITTVSKNLFYNCSSLTSIAIPAGVTEIESDAFNLCRKLTSVSIPDGVKTLGNSSFYGCSDLTTITIPASVDSIGNNAFAYCINLTAFDIPDAVKKIGSYTFYSCLKLNNITIGSNVESIGSCAFSMCPSLTSITCNALTPPTLEDKAFDFDDIEGSVTLTIPEDAEELYRSTDWNKFLPAPGATDDQGTGIASTELDAPQATEAYDISGRRQNGLKQGLNIVRMSDGTTKKLIK